ncbi:inhibitor of apoptosis [Mizuhopecten yessoensis]|uniref:Inhibitor of apoptosis n=1 Tax=Mizuhopecten yessoensis TaxID=6573 RepID=A0A210Q202_MIZYE|nr:inhibitor of apoptosis [Mizuhopecten yessoensis]
MDGSIYFSAIMKLWWFFSGTLDARESNGSHVIQTIKNDEFLEGKSPSLTIPVEESLLEEIYPEIAETFPIGKSEETIENSLIGESRAKRLSSGETPNEALNVGESTLGPKTQYTRESISKIKTIHKEDSVSDTRHTEKSIVTNEIRHAEKHAIKYTRHKKEKLETTDTDYAENYQWSYFGQTGHEELNFTTGIIAEDVNETSLARHKEETLRGRDTGYTGDSYLTNHTKPTEDFPERNETGYTGFVIDNQEKCKENSDKRNADKSNATGDKNGVKQRRTTDIGTADDKNTVKQNGTTEDENKIKPHGTTDDENTVKHPGITDVGANENCNEKKHSGETDKCHGASAAWTTAKCHRAADNGNTVKQDGTTEDENNIKPSGTTDVKDNENCNEKTHSGETENCNGATASWNTEKCHRTADNEITIKCQGAIDSGNILNCHGAHDTGNTEKCQEKEDTESTVKCNGTADTGNVESFYGTADYGENEEINRSATGKHYRTIEDEHAGACFRTTNTEHSEKSYKPADTRLIEEPLRITDSGRKEKESVFDVQTQTEVHLRGTAKETTLTNDKCGTSETGTRDEIHEQKESSGIILNETARELDTSIETEHRREPRDHSSYDANKTNDIEGLCKEADNINFNRKSSEGIYDRGLGSKDIKGIPASTSNTTSNSDIQPFIGACPFHDSIGMDANMAIVHQNITEEVSVINTISASISSADNQNENTTDCYDDSKEETMVKTVFVNSTNEFDYLDNSLLYNEPDESDEESLDESVTEINECCTSETIGISDSFSSSSITTSDEIPDKICQGQHSGEDRMIEMSEYVSCFFESEEDEKHPAKTLDTISNYCNSQESHNINGQGNDAIPMHSYDVSKELGIRVRSTTNLSLPLNRKKTVIPTFYERNVLITSFVRNHFIRHNQFSIRRLRAATFITQDLSSLWNIVMPFHQPDRNEDQTFNRSPNVETDNYEDRNAGAIEYSDAGRRSHDSEITSDAFYTICMSSVTESMRFEWGRFKSFWSFPMDCPALPTLLAKYGFYYTGNRDEVVCFSCNVSHSNWNRGDSVYAVHYQMSSRCRFMNGEDVGNVPIHGPLSCLSRRAGGRDGALVGSAAEIEMRSKLSTPETVTSLFIGQDPANQVIAPQREQPLPLVQMNQTENNDRSQVGNHPMETRNSAECGGGSNFSLTGFQAEAPSGGASVSRAAAVSQESTMTMSRPSQTPSASQPPCLQTHASTTSHTALGPHTATSNTATPAANRLLTGPNASPTSNQVVTAPTGNQALTDQTCNQPQSMNQQHPTTFAQRQQQRLEQQDQREQQQPEQGQAGPAIANGAARNLNNLVVTTAKPRYPNYAVLAVRSGTFNGFPNHLDQTPLQMARAGFFYAGYGDYVRCFFCGGGLRNWEAGDDPWVEHARWFPRCTHVKQNRGQTFINLVLQRQRELTLPNEYINTTREASSIDSNANSQDQTARIQANTDKQSSASNAQIRSNTQTGTSTNTLANTQNSTASVSIPVELTAFALLEIIFGFEDIPPETPDQTQTSSHNAEGLKTEEGGSFVLKRETNNAENKIEEPQAAATASASQHLIPRNKLRELKSIQEENSQLKEQMKCKICMDNFVCISFLPCGHLCCCAECAPAMVKCPICRQIVRGSVKTYLT